MIFVAIIGIVVVTISSIFVNNRGATEHRAYDGMKLFIARNNIADIKRNTCAGDSDGDGYGTCTIVTSQSETITIQCPTDWMDLHVFGVSSCKEIPIFRLQSQPQQR